MKPNNFPPAGHPVEIVYHPHSRWTIEVNNVWPAANHRRNLTAPHSGDRPAPGFAPVELVIAAENKKRAQWQVNCRVPLWADKF